MNSMNTERTLSVGKKREDRGVQLKYKFGPLNLDVKCPGTAILLLQCQENTILLNAATALSKYATKSQENIKILFDLDIVKSIIPLINHENIFTRRFAAKLLAEMTAIPFVRDFLLESDYHIPYFTKVLIDEKDLFMQEFSSLILAELSKDMYGTARLLEQCPNTNFLYERIQSTDPDVKKNNIEIIYNLIQDPIGVQEIIYAENFSFPLIYRLLQEPYPEIQHLALNVIGDLLARKKDEYIHNLFRETKGLEALLNFLANDDWRDLHSKVLKILSLASDNHKTIELLNSIGGIQRIYKYMENTPNPKLFADAFDVVICFADILIGRKALYLNGIVDHLINTLEKNVQPDMYLTICYGIGKMVSYGPAGEKLSNGNVIKNILNVLKNDNLKWITRNSAMFALNELFNYNADNCKNFLELRGEEYLIWLIKQPLENVPLEIRLLAVQALIAIAHHSTLRNLVIKENTIDALCTSFEACLFSLINCSTIDELKILSCQALSMFCIDKIGRDAFLKVHGSSRLHYLLSDLHSIPVRNAAVQLVQVLSVDSVLANAFVQTKYLSYMLNNRVSARIIPSWDTCIETLFNSHLPAKFAFTGRLSLHDITKDGFYVLRQNICPFPVLNDLFRFKLCPLEPVYVVNTARSYSSIPTNNINEKDMEEAKNSIVNENASKGVFVSEEVLNSWLHLMFGRLQLDPYLCEYIDLLKCKLVAMESKDLIINEDPNLINISNIASRAKMLAEFVARQMSGPDPSSTCLDHQLEVHLREIKESIGTSVIPLGQLRVGSYLERAVLFKVLADKICLPTALVRGEYGTAWVEIAIPQIEVPPEDTSFSEYLMQEGPCTDWIIRNITLMEENQLLSKKLFSQVQSVSNIAVPWKLQQSIFPSKLMKPNVIVDLIEKPGQFIPIHSELGKTYKCKKIICDLICSPEL
ncbi:armadillo repeat-containing protein 3 [Vespula squamosa]|uniref:Armadillo repeat-containing protein 3 n=1 Tax=Vespula squamosa TaxID=30214 RepID=A0ABD2AFL3_VESSQ